MKAQSLEIRLWTSVFDTVLVRSQAIVGSIFTAVGHRLVELGGKMGQKTKKKKSKLPLKQVIGLFYTLSNHLSFGFILCTLFYY